MTDKFEEAYRRARRKIGAAAWRRLSDEEREEAVAVELRALEEDSRDENGDRDAKLNCGWRVIWSDEKRGICTTAADPSQKGARAEAGILVSGLTTRRSGGAEYRPSVRLR